jgi:DNA-binding GntR family transcriptional regulator
VPTTGEFADEYGVSEASAYRALSLLVYAGILRGESGRGRFVPEKPPKSR